MKWLTYGLASLLLPLGILLSASTAIPTQPKPAASAFVVNSTGDEPDLLPGDDICLTAAGTCTLRAAIQEANGDIIAGPDTITFTAAASIIRPTSPLPPITQPLEIDGSGGSPRAQLVGNLIAAANNHGLQLGAGSAGSSIKALVIRNFTGAGIRITSNNNRVENCYVGTDATGNSAQPNGAGGLVINLATGNTVGGASAAQRNVISGNSGDGVALVNAAAMNTVQGNYIGVGADGATDVGNTMNGVSIGAASNQQVGGPTAAPGTERGNVISGNGSNGIEIDDGGGTTSSNNVQGNLIGTTAAGTAALRNDSNGILITSSSATTVGGPDASLRNVISANGNVSTEDGVDIANDASDDNVVAGNYIGTDITGTVDLGNAGAGVNIRLSADNNTVGGVASTPGSPPGNVISGNGSDGITIDGSGSTGNKAQGNLVGLQADGSTALKNDLHGIRVDNSSGHTVGGTAAGSGNAIAFNGGDGVFIPAGTGNRVSSNSIHSNAGLGIDLGADGVTPDDAGDADAGANNLQNFPALTAAATGSTTVQGTLNSTANTTFRIEFFSSPSPDPSQHGEGMTFLGATDVMTNATGNASFTFTTATTVPTGQFITATATNPGGNTSEFSKAFDLIAPTAVEMAEVKAAIYKNGALVEWRTGFEVDNLGFNLYREQGGRRTLINPEIIAGSALLAGPGSALTAGRSYRWIDDSAEGEQEIRYWLEEIDLQGKGALHDLRPFTTYYGIDMPADSVPVKATTIKGLAADSERPGRGSLSRQAAVVARPARPRAATLQAQAAVAAESAVKLSIRQEGWYRVTQPELFAAGLSPQVNPRLLQLFVDGREIPIIVKGQGDNRFDPPDSIEFYGVGLDTPTTDARTYYLVAGAQAGKRVPVSQLTAVPSQATSFPYAVQRKDRRVYFAALKNGDKENFFGSVINRDGVEQVLSASRVDGAAAAPGLLEIALQGVTTVPHQVRVRLNGVDAGTIGFQGQFHVIKAFPIEQSLVREGDNRVSLIAEAGASDISLIDYIRLTYSHGYVADGDSLSFTSAGKQAVTVGGFAASAIRAVDVTDPDSVTELAGVVQGGKQGFSLKASPPGSGQRRLFAFTEAGVRRPAAITPNHPSTLRQPSAGADLVIIAHGSLARTVEPLAGLRRGQGLAVVVVDIEDIYDEFSFGQRTPRAVKDFISRARGTWQRPPRFVLLVGDATLDPRDYTGRGDSDLVPTKLIDTLALETASDDWFGDSDGDGVPEVAIGRLPARTPAEASSLVGKIVAYDQSESSNRVLLVSDRDDGFRFSAAGKELRALVPARFDVDVIDRNVTDDQTARATLLQAINGGVTLINYAGHGASDLWRGDLLTAADGSGLTNGDRLALFVSMTCLNGFFHDTHVESLAESLLKAPGGAIAVWASSGLTSPGGQAAMGVDLFGRLFGGVTIGEAMMQAKLATPDVDVRRTWVLLGDPTMRLR